MAALRRKAFDQQDFLRLQLKPLPPGQAPTAGNMVNAYQNPNFNHNCQDAAGQIRLMAALGIHWTASGGMFISGSRFFYNPASGKWMNATAGRVATSAEQAQAAAAAQGLRAIPRAGALRSTGSLAWESAAGLRYVGVDPNGLNRVLHVLRHANNMPGRTIHGVFDGSPSAVLGLVDEAWGLRNTPGALMSAQGNIRVYVVPMGRRVGYVGGQVGANNGFPAAHHIRIVVKHGNQVQSAYPVVP